MDQSNADAIDKALAPFADGDNPDVRAEHHGHWACGWIDGYAIRVYRNGQITEAFRAYHELAARLADYPVLNEEDFSRREYEATLENLLSEGFDSDYFAPPDEWEGEVFSWLWDHNQSAVENRDGQGGYATKEEIAEALDALGYRILWVVSYVDTGEVREEYNEDGRRKSGAKSCAPPVSSLAGLTVYQKLRRCPMPDVLVDNFGSVVGITPMTPAAQEWIDENCQTEGWQWLGATLNVEPRYAGDIVAGMQADGLTVE